MFTPALGQSNNFSNILETINVLQSSVSNYLSFKQPTDIFTQNKTFLSAYRKFQKVTPGYKPSQHLKNVHFLFNLNHLDGDIVNTIFLKIKLPQQELKNGVDFFGYQDLYAIKCIKKVSLRIGDFTLETLYTEQLYRLYKKIHAENWQDFSKNYLKNDKDTKKIFCVDNSIAKNIVPQIEVFLPLPFSFLNNIDKMKLNLLDNCMIKIDIEMSLVEEVSIFNCDFSSKLKQINLSECVLFFELYSYNVQDVLFKSNNFLSVDADKKPYIVNDSWINTINKKIEQDNFYSFDFAESNTKSLLFSAKLDIFTKQQVLFYGYNNFNATCNFLNCFFEYETNANGIYLNLKKGILLNNNDVYSNLLQIEKKTPFKHALTFNYNGTKFSCEIISSTEWSKLSRDIFINLSETLLSGINNAKILNILYFSRLYFGFYDITNNSDDENEVEKIEEKNIMYDVETKDQYDNYKMLGGMFVNFKKKQYVLGITNFEINNLVIDSRVIDILVSQPVNIKNMGNFFLKKNFVYYNNALNYSLDIDNSIKFELKNYEIKNSLFDQDIVFLFNNELHKSENSQNLVEKYKNDHLLEMNFDAKYSNGTLDFKRQTVFKLYLESFEYFSIFLKKIEQADLITRDNFFLNFNVTQVLKRILMYSNNSIEELPSENFPMLQENITQNFSIKKVYKKRRVY